MSDVNEAYRVLSDPARRLEYDRSLRPGSSAAGGGPHLAGGDGVSDAVRFPTPVPPSRLMPAGPARVPWKMMTVMAVVGSAVILFAAAVSNDSPSVEPPDGILRAGSCVTIESNLDVREVACTGTDDVVVELFIPTGATCPTGLGTFPDRLGFGKICIDVG